MRTHLSRILLIALAVAFVPFFSPIQALGAGDGVDPQLIKRLNESLCADPSLNGKTAESGKSGSAANPVTMEASVCSECDIKAATEPTKLANVEQATAPIGKVIETALERERIKREIAYFEFASDASDPNSITSLKSKLAAYESNLTGAKQRIEEYEAEVVSKQSLIDQLTAVQRDRNGLAAGDKEKIAKLLASKISIEKEIAEHISELIQDNRDSINGEPKSPQAKLWTENIQKYEKRAVEQSKKLASLGSISSWARGGVGAQMPSDEDLELGIASFKKDVELAKENTQAYRAQEKQFEDLVQKTGERIKGTEKKVSVSNSEPTDEELLSRLRALEKRYGYNSSYGSSGSNSCGLSAAERYALRDYTAGGYMGLNHALRSSGEARERHTPFEQVLNSALDKLRSYEGMVNRGADLPAAVLEQHKVGDVVTYASFTSSSIGSSFGGDHQFVIKSKTGKYIAPYSGSYGEYEVLFKSNTKFRILSREEVGGNIRFVMEEVAE